MAFTPLSGVGATTVQELRPANPHNLLTVTDADEIIYLEHGRITEPEPAADSSPTTSSTPTSITFTTPQHSPAQQRNSHGREQ
ncbi:MAG: hypothetical protein ACRDRO_15830 [Pseudonocardiaceae bacterium]